jgi:hypothetical protein
MKLLGGKIIILAAQGDSFSLHKLTLSKTKEENSIMAKCYMCSANAVSDEHVPPKCIFPEKKDLMDGLDYRKNLITVPSCVDHNLRKSGDDEYLLYILVGNFEVNSTGLRQWATKLKRSMDKTPSKKGIFHNMKTILYRGFITGAYEVDFDRIYTEFEFISRGIYFNHFKQQWLYDIQLTLPLAAPVGNSDTKKYNQTVRTINAFAKDFLIDEKKFGDNPEVFYYQCKTNPDQPGFVLRMVFYGGIEVVALSNPQVNAKIIAE